MIPDRADCATQFIYGRARCTILSFSLEVIHFALTQLGGGAVLPYTASIHIQPKRWRAYALDFRQWKDALILMGECSRPF